MKHTILICLAIAIFAAGCHFSMFPTPEDGKGVMADKPSPLASASDSSATANPTNSQNPQKPGALNPSPQTPPVPYGWLIVIGLLTAAGVVAVIWAGKLSLVDNVLIAGAGAGAWIVADVWIKELWEMKWVVLILAAGIFGLLTAWKLYRRWYMTDEKESSSPSGVSSPPSASSSQSSVEA